MLVSLLSITTSSADETLVSGIQTESTPTRAAGHQRMLALLKDVVARTPPGSFRLSRASRSTLP